jgi:hypothetical protein
MKAPLFFYLIITVLFFNSCKKSERPLPPNLPIVTTMPVTSIENDRATAGFTITNTDTVTIIESGIVWSINSLPKIPLATQASINIDTSAYSFYMTGLSCSTKYFVRAYTITSSDTIYGNQIEFTTSVLSPYVKQLDLSKILSTDTTIEKFQVDMAWPSAGASFLSELTLPEGVYMYVRFDSVHHNVRCNNGISSRLVIAGDTVHFGQILPAGGFGIHTGISVIAAQYITGMGDVYNDSEAEFSIHVAGTAVTSETSYLCKYYLGGYGLTNTTHQRIYKNDTTVCSTPCAFQ